MIVLAPFARTRINHRRSDFRDILGTRSIWMLVLGILIPVLLAPLVEAQGISPGTCSLGQLRVVELAASAVKLGVTGSGRASKQQVQAMVKRILGLDEVPRPVDAADALAVAIVFAQRNRSRVVLSQHGTGGDSSGPRLDSRAE